MYSARSERLTVPVAEGILNKGIKAFTWKLHLPRREHEACVGLVKAGFGSFDRPVTVNGQDVLPLDILNTIIACNTADKVDKIPVRQSNEIHFAI